MKKTLLILLTIIASVALLTVTASASTVETGTVGDFTVEVIDEGFGRTPVITGYTGAGGAVTLPATFKGETIVTIRDNVFKGNTSITSLVIPEGYTQLSNSTFEGCTKLTRVQLPNSLYYIGRETFLGCTGLKSVNIPSGIDSLGTDTFKNCTALESITIPAGIENMGMNTFSGCTGLKTAILEEGITTTPSFYGCTSLKSVKLPSTMKSIGDGDFAYCASLTDITLPDGLKNIGYMAFAGCESLKQINIPASVTSISDGAFAWCYGLTAVHITDLEAWCHIKYDRSDFVSPGNPVLLAEALYLNGKPLEHLVIPESVTDIQDSLFVDCKTIKTVTLHNKVTRIGKAAFSGCENLKKINIPSGVKEIGDSAFYNCASLTELSLPKTLTKLGTSALSSTGLKSVTLPSTLTAIPYGLLNGCKSLTSVTIPSTVKTIGQRAFMLCTALPAITIPSSVTTIETDAFWRCSSLERLEIPASVTTIGDTAFYDCSALERLIFKGNVPNIGADVFVYCTSLRSVVFPEGFTAIPGRTFGMCMDLQSVVLPKSIKTVGDSAFFNCPVAHVYYAGTKTQAKAISIGAENTTFSGATWHYSHKSTGLKITAQPKTACAPRQTYVSTTVKATGDGLGYAWYVKDAGATKYTRDIYSNDATYKELLTVDTKDRRVYCIVTDAYGNSVKSNTVYLREQVTITTEPQTVRVPYGETAKLTVKARGDGLTYTWYFKNEGKSTFSKSSITGSTYSCKMSEASKYRQVYCVVKDKYGNEARTFTCYIYPKITPLAITTQPKTGYAVKNGTAKVTVKATGNGVRYTWYIKNAGKKTFSKSSVTTATYSCKLTSSSKNRQVYCIVTDNSGVRLQTKTVYLREKVSITTQPKTGYAVKGATAKVTVKASGDGLTYTWYVRNASASKYVKSSITSATYSCKLSATTKDRRVYCVVKDKYGNTVQTKTVVLREKVSITTQPKTVSVAKNATAKVTVKAAGDELTYTWYFKNAGKKTFSKSSVTTATYSCKMTATTKNRQVYCVVKDKYGNKAQTSTVQLKMK